MDKDRKLEYYLFILERKKDEAEQSKSQEKNPIPKSRYLEDHEV